LDVGLLVAAQCQADDVDVVFLQGAVDRGAPAAADVEQSHPRREAEFAEGQVDLGELCFLERHVVALEVGAAVGLRGIEEQLEELVGQVVMGLHVVEVGLEVRGARRCLWQGTAFRRSTIFRAWSARWFRPTLGV
jgi:hypothetical protein